MKKIAILGCGWLGFPLGQRLVSEGFSVKGSTRSDKKADVLSAAGIAQYSIILSENGIVGPIAEFLENTDVLIVDIPPKISQGGHFPTTVSRFIPHIEKARIRLVIFVSSTSVYPDLPETFSEDDAFTSDSENGKQLLEAEKILSDNPDFQTIVLRPGGLIGEDRHPVYHLSGRSGIAKPDAPVNLVHRNDVIGMLLLLIRNGATHGIFNAVAPSHPSRNPYYSEKARAFGLELPQFDLSDKTSGKIVSSEKILAMGYGFLHPDL